MEQKASILIAEDDHEVGAILLEHLTDKGYETILATDGEDALTRLLDKKFNVVVLDLKMPKVGGLGILKYIKLNVPATKVIILTAYADLTNIEECKKLGADDVIAKPHDLGDLMDAIEYLLKN